VQALVKSGLASSGKVAKRLIADGGARLNDKTVSDGGLMIPSSDLKATVKLSAGKKRHALLGLK